MRFCPFCSAENADESTHCSSCARRLPALPRRRTEASQPNIVAADRPAPRRATSTPAPRASTGTVMPAPHSRPASLPHVGPAAQRRQPSPDSPPPRGTPERRKTDGEPAMLSSHRAAGESAPRAASEPPPMPRPESTGRIKEPTLPEPPPTRVTAGEEIAGAFHPPKLDPIPDVPESGLIPAARYAVTFLRARWQRRSAIKALNDDIRTETASLDSVLGALGKQVRSLELDNRALASENAAIDAAEGKRAKAETASAELANREAEENAKFGDISSEREAKVSEAEARLEKAEREHGAFEAQRRGLREKRKQVETRQKGLLKAAEDRESQAGKAQLGDERMSFRRAAEDLRRDAAALDPERQDIERRFTALERPLSQALAKVDALKQELDSAKRSLNDAREGHRHRLAEIEAEQGRKSRELAQADAEVQRRLVTLGTLVNLHRIERPEFKDLYARIDKLRGAIGAQSTEIDRLTAERDAYDKASLVRGLVVLGGGVVGFITFIVILVWIF
jgi:hypothetical protein